MPQSGVFKPDPQTRTFDLSECRKETCSLGVPRMSSVAGLSVEVSLFRDAFGEPGCQAVGAFGCRVVAGQFQEVGVGCADAVVALLVSPYEKWCEGVEPGCRPVGHTDGDGELRVTVGEGARRSSMR
jgi:hypothetical protein